MSGLDISKTEQQLVREANRQRVDLKTLSLQAARALKVSLAPMEYEWDEDIAVVSEALIQFVLGGPTVE